MLLSIAYFPPISWFAAASSGLCLSDFRERRNSTFYVEACENYQKQSYRNRCRFLASGGIETLSVPIVHENGTFSLPITQIKIDYTENWVLRTERALSSAYYSSPFFEYYKDELFAILDSRVDTLWELDTRLIRFFLDKTGLPLTMVPTERFTSPGSMEYGEDLRNVIHPKKADPILDRAGLNKPYYQVFAQKYGFTSNMSILDLLFNEGSEALTLLVPCR